MLYDQFLNAWWQGLWISACLPIFLVLVTFKQTGGIVAGIWGAGGWSFMQDPMAILMSPLLYALYPLYAMFMYGAPMISYFHEMELVGFLISVAAGYGVGLVLAWKWLPKIDDALGLQYGIGFYAAAYALAGQAYMAIRVAKLGVSAIKRI